MKATIGIILYIIINISIYSQGVPYDWELPINTQIPTGVFGQTPANDWDIAVDNFGMHFIGIYDYDAEYRGVLKYTLVDNNGFKKDENFNVGSNGAYITAASLCTYNGKTYVVLAYSLHQNFRKIRVYEKTNTHPITSTWTYKDQYDAESTGGAFPRSIDICADENGLHIVYSFRDDAGASSNNIYYLNYKINESRWANFSGGPRIQIVSLTSGGRRPVVTTSNQNNIKRAHVAFAVNTIRTRDIKFNSYDDVTLENTISTNYWGTGRFGSEYTDFEWGNIIADPRANGKLYVISTPAYLQGQIFVDSRLKSREISTQSWDENAGILNEYDFINHFFPQSAFYDGYQENNKIPVCYGYVRGIGLGQRSVIEYREFDIIQQQFQSPTILFDQMNGGAYGPCIMEADSQGVYVAVYGGPNPPKIQMVRKPREYRANINYNALWSGFVYINAPAAPFCRTAGADIEAIEGSITRLKTGTNVFIDVNDYIRFKQNSCVVFEPQAEIFQDGGNLYYETSCIQWSSPTCNRAMNGGSINIGANLGNFTVNNGGFLVIDGGCTLEIGENTNLVMDGNTSYLILQQGANIKLGIGARITLKNGAYINANGCTFTSINSGETWSGIYLEDAGNLSIIQNSSFSNFSNAISISHSPGYESLNKVVQNNIFNFQNTPIQGAAAIYANNVFSLLVYGNTFNMGTNAENTGLVIYNTTSQSGDGAAGGPSSSYSLNIMNNTFNGSGNSISLNCLAANQIPFFVKGNIFYTSQFNPYSAIWANKISGSFKNNLFMDLNSSTSIFLQQSTINLYSNIFKSSYNTIDLQSGSATQMAPVQNIYGQWVWYGGYNKITSDFANCINFSSGSTPITAPLGRNCFYINTSPYTHFTGEWCIPKTFHCYDNFWSPGIPVFNINCGINPATVNYNPQLLSCPNIPAEEEQIEYLGNGVYDTILVTSVGGNGGENSNNSSIKKTAAVDAILYSEAITKRKDGNFAHAILKCKELINNHDTSFYLQLALGELYLNYLESDTTQNINITVGLFNELKSYLEFKMQQYQSNQLFIENAYKYVLMCLVKIRSFQEAIDGYENISNNHPDPIIRLNASWDRSTTVLLMNGSGGAYSSSNYQKSKTLKKLFDKNPVHKIAYEIFKQIKDTYASSDNSVATKYTIEDRVELNRRIESFNPSSSEELKKKVTSDIKLVCKIMNRKAEITSKLTTVNKFKLLQNYPNPFNPLTVINYSIPNKTIVVIKVYDVLGELVTTLVNESKTRGDYSVTFDASGLSSGIYFYKIEAGDYTDSKKMMLVK